MAPNQILIKVFEDLQSQNKNSKIEIDEDVVALNINTKNKEIYLAGDSFKLSSSITFYSNDKTELFTSIISFPYSEKHNIHKLKDLFQRMYKTNIKSFDNFINV